jgi:hypothetical protein
MASSWRVNQNNQTNNQSNNHSIKQSLSARHQKKINDKENEEAK